MIKRIKKICACFLVAIFGLFSMCFVAGTTQKHAVAGSDPETTRGIKLAIQRELEEFIEYNVSNNLKTRRSRIAGSKAEYNSAEYIKGELAKLSNYKAVNNKSTTDGVESFQFTGIHDGKSYVSQNIIFKRESIMSTNRKVVIATHYDTAYVYSEGNDYASGIGQVSDGVNDNAASVATLLALVKELDKNPLDYGYDIEIVFFGASANDYAGSRYYMRGQSDEDVKDTLLMINLDKIGLGEFNYAYVNEFKTPQEDYIFDVLSHFRGLKQQNILDFSMESPNGLEYTHIGLESDHAVFMARNINVLSFISGNYENALTYGVKEYDGLPNTTYTINDNYSYISLNYSNFFSNLYNVYVGIRLLLQDDNFIAELEKENGLAVKYEFWKNEKVAVFITSILLVGAAFVCVLIYWNLQKKSREAAGSGVTNLVIKIMDNMGAKDEDQEINDAIDQKLKKDTKEESDDKKEK